MTADAAYAQRTLDERLVPLVFDDATATSPRWTG